VLFQVIFPMPNGTDLLQIQAVMPAGWTVEEIDIDRNNLNILNNGDGGWVGFVRIQPNKIVISVKEDDPRGGAFWRAFGTKYPELNPFDLRFGVLYLPGGKRDKWELDEFPEHSRQEILEVVPHYNHAMRACYVSFLLGNWHAGEEILTTSCRDFKKNGKLGPIQEDVLFLLGK